MRKNFRKMASAATAMLLATVVMVFGLTSPAHAGSGTIYTTVGDGYMTYNVNTTKNTLTFSVTTGALPTDQCVTGYVDLKRAENKPTGSGSHLDARSIRVCRPYTTYTSGLQYEGNTYHIDVTSVQKLAVCRGADNQLGTCNNPTYDQPRGKIRSVHPEFGDDCTRMWRIDINNKFAYHDAGNVFSCQK